MVHTHPKVHHRDAPHNRLDLIFVGNSLPVSLNEEKKWNNHAGPHNQQPGPSAPSARPLSSATKVSFPEFRKLAKIA